MQRAHLEYPAWEIEEMGHWTLQDSYYIRPHNQDTESKQLYLIQRNKHREAAKIRRQRNMTQMKGQIKTSEKELNEMEISNLSDAEFKTPVSYTHLTLPTTVGPCRSRWSPYH